MNILVINGSPKGERSNSLKLTNAFLDGINAARKDNLPVIEKLNIAQMKIDSCLGCFACWNKTPGKCVIHDDMQIVLEKMLWADLMIWSFPLYYFSVPGKLKTLMDRQLPLTLPFMSAGVEGGAHPLRYDMSGKRTVLISTCGFYTAKSNYDSVTAQFDRILGKGNYTTLFTGQGELFRVPALANRTDEYLEYVDKPGRIRFQRHKQRNNFSTGAIVVPARCFRAHGGRELGNSRYWRKGGFFFDLHKADGSFV